MKENIKAFLEFRFEKIKLLQKTAKGEVWLAENKATKKFVIIKCMNFTGLPYGALQKISGELWAEIFYCAEDSADTVVVEEFIQGQNLSELKKFLTENEAKNLMLQLCDGLKILHDAGIIHRDIKPSNLILQGNKIRLIDFDAARIFSADKNKDTKFLGTEGYAPPEQFGFGQTDPRSDIYSLGVTMFELLGGNCSSNLKKILRKCTEFDPRNRFQTVEELKIALLEKSNATLRPVGVLKIFLLTLVLIFIFQSKTVEEKITSTAEVEKNVAVKGTDISADNAPSKTDYQFPEIKIPENPAVTNFDAPKNIPVQKISEPSQTKPVEQNKNPSPPIRKNIIRALAKSFLNGKAMDDWNFYFVNVVHVQKQDWENFFDWVIEIDVKNFPKEILQNPQVKVICENSLDDEYLVEKIFAGKLVGEEIKFSIPLNQFKFQLEKLVTIVRFDIYLLDSFGQNTETRRFFQFMLIST